MRAKTALKTIAIAMMMILGVGAGVGFCLPEVKEVVNGTAEIQIKDQNTMTITASEKAIINYNSFNIMEHESVMFYLPSSNDAILNRVVTATPSRILGTMGSNGIIILVNEAGIYVGPQATINAGALVLSTRDITNQRFIDGEYMFKRISQEEFDKLLINEGNITISNGGFGVLIAGAIENKGVITAKAGTIALASGNAVRLEMSGNRFIGVAIEEPVARTIRDYQGRPITDQIKNTGTLDAEGGTVILAAESINDIFTSAINMEGTVKATHLEEKDGKVYFATSGYVSLGGEVRATNIVVGEPSQNIVPKSVTIEPTALVRGEVSITISAQEAINVGSTLKAPAVKLVSGDTLNTMDMAIIQGTNLNLTAQRFGTSETPVRIYGSNIIIERLNGDIDIRSSVGIGTNVWIRGPPEEWTFGSILYNSDASQLTLEGVRVITSGTELTALTAANKIELIGLQGVTIGGMTRIAVPAGYILINGMNGDALLEAGSVIDASNDKGIGGRVEILGHQVILIGATIDVSGTTGGGTVLIGGDFQGKGTLFNAEIVLINRNSYIYADATISGNGGMVIVWSDVLTSYFGHISSRGGPEDGNGGFIQVSSSGTLRFNGFIDATAPSGERGTLILDPLGTSGYAACLVTDKLDYYPGETVTIMGYGWTAGETVLLVLKSLKDGIEDLLINITADKNGYFSDSSFTPKEEHRGVTFILTASGLSSGLSSRTEFTDAAFTASVSGNWSNTATWGGGTYYPGQQNTADTVTINNGIAVTLNITPAYAIASLTLKGGNAANSLTFSGTNSLTVTGAVTINAPTANVTKVVAVGAGTLNAGSISITSGSNINRRSQVTVSTGTINCTGNITFGGTQVSARLTFTGSGTLNLGGNLGTGGTFVASTGTVNCNGSAVQTVAGYTYNVLKSNNTAGVTLAAAITVSTLTIGDVTSNSVFSDGGYQVTSTGTLNLTSGTFKLGSGTVATNFPAFTTRNIAAGTTVEYASSAAQTVSTTPSYSNLTFSGAGTKTVAAGTLTIGGNWVVGSTTALNTNNPTINLTGNLSGSGAITAGSSTINIAGNWTNNGTFTAGSGTVNYNAASGGQTIGSLIYNNLTLSNTSGTQTAAGNITVNGTLTTTAGGTLDMATYQLLGTLSTINNNGTIRTQNTSATPIPAGKTWGGTVNYDGASQTISTGTYNNLTVSGSGVKTVNHTSTVINGTGTISGTAQVLLIVSATGIDKVYDGTATATVNLSFPNIFTAYSVSATYASATFDAGKNVGTGKSISVSGISLIGADASKFTLNGVTTATATANITAKDVTITGVSASKVYDGTTAGTSALNFSSAVINGKVSGDDLSINYSSATASYDNKNVGTNHLVTVSGVSLSGSDASNYNLASQPSITDGVIT
ncbi:MAG: YDG domain-containing protein, partial [Candidatus Omnitrophica bacterium]|nr:YDG domain-containing protein [Candidatus Omnitrophota bacterium]